MELKRTILFLEGSANLAIEARAGQTA